MIKLEMKIRIGIKIKIESSDLHQRIIKKRIQVNF